MTHPLYIVKCLLRKAARMGVITPLLLLCLISKPAKAQYFDLQGDKKHVTIPFRLIRDLIIIQLEINGKGPFNFVLDSGVGLMLITDPKLVDSINVTNKHTIKIAGLGKGDDIEAYITTALNVGIPGLNSYDIVAAIMKTDHFGLSRFAGIPIHGLIGYEFLNNLAVKIDFADSTLTVSKPKNMRLFGKSSKIPISIENQKAYLSAKVIFPDGRKTDEKLILDLGAGHPILLDNEIKKHGMPDKFIAANLGVGLNGPIEGFVSRVNEVDIGKYKLKDVLVSLPVDSGLSAANAEHRDGNLGMGILKKFSLIIDYPDSAIYIKPNNTFDEPFEHDMSGLEYFKAGENYDHVIINRVEPGSPADAVGIEPGDEIISINFKEVSKMTLEQIDALFKSRPDRTLLIEVSHDKKTDAVILTLKRRI